MGADDAAGRGRPGSPPAAAANQATYVGAEACQECHEKEYQSFKANSKKVHSFASVKRMSHALSETEMKQCYECHTTGYGKPGGFVSEQQTPKMAEASCEVCHGPGGLHAQSQSKSDIKGKLEAKDCLGCHNAERVQAFNFRPLIYSGGH
ncbi:MAG: cytochrome c family protein [Pseudomonadota bacterium]